MEDFTGAGSLHAEDRRKRILDILYREGKVRVNDLRALFGTSEVTIRSDLTELEKSGLLERTHGGAIPTTRTYYNMNFHERANRRAEEKKTIARATAAIVENGHTVMINSGTTTHCLSNELRGHKNLKIVTNAISIAQNFGGLPTHSVIMLGGNLNVEYSFTYGYDAVSQVRRYRSDILILSVDGVSAECGLTTYHYEEAEIDRAMIERANRIIVVADYTKIGRESFAFVNEATCIDCIVTNNSAPAAELEKLAALGIEIIAV